MHPPGAARSRFLLGLLNGMVPLWPTLVSEVCGKEHEVVGMGVMTSESLATINVCFKLAQQSSIL